MTAVDVSVVVPAHDEAPHVGEHLRRIAAEMERLGRSFEVLLVDDGSRDGTGARAEEAAVRDPRVRVLRHERNLGKGAALATGCAAARGATLVFLDADLEVSPDHVGPCLSLVDPGGADVAVGSKYDPRSRRRRPLARVVLSRLYQAVTAVLFRLPIRDTQTGLKAIRRDLARRVVPAIRARRYAWDLELLLLSHRLGARIEACPVSVDFLDRGVRVPWRGFLAAGLDTVRTFVRDRWLAGYAADLRGVRPRRRPRPTRVLLSADDAGLCASVDRGCLEAVRAERVRSVSLLAGGATAEAVAPALEGLHPGADVGVHVDLVGASLGTFLRRAATGRVDPRDVRDRVRAQVARARALGVCPTHVDAHRHAFLLPRVYRSVLAAARAEGVRAARLPRPLGSLRCGPGAAGIAKGLVLAAASPFLAPIPRALGLATPDGIADAATARRWADSGRLPRSVRGRTVEIVSHPVDGDGTDVPPAERALDRHADVRALEGLRRGLEALGAETTTFAALAASRRR